MRNVVLVDQKDNQVGFLDIWEAHKNPGVLHRAVSVILYNSSGEILLQQRSQKKPLWPGYWSNTFCTHPYEGETYIDCAIRRGQEEMGITLNNIKLEKVYRFEYQANYNSDLSEHELDTVIIGKYDGAVAPHPDEASDYKWIAINKIESTFDQDKLTPWFKLLLKDKRFLNLVERSK